MADTIQFDLVSPERKLASVTAAEVQIPGAEGDLTAMAGHAATILTMRPGVLTVKGDAGDAEYVVVGGFAEVAAENVAVLAEMALPRDEVTQDIVSDLIGKATASKDAATPEDADTAAKFLADLVAVAEGLGFTA